MGAQGRPLPGLRSSSFGSAAQEYDRRRLAPPPAALAWMLGTDARVVLDLAAGTGQISRQLDRPGLEVIAVEPDPDMRAVLERNSPHARVLDGSAEAIPLDAGSVDAVLVGSAWHWFDLERAPTEIARVLRPGGRLGAVGLSPDPFVDWVATVMGARAEPHRQSVRRLYVDVEAPSPAFGALEVHEFGFGVRMTPEDVRAEFATHSYYLVASDEERARLDTHVLATVGERFPGAQVVELPMRAWCWRVDHIGT